MGFYIPEGEYENHVSRVQDMMKKLDLDAILSYANEQTYSNVFYLTRYRPLFEVGGVVMGQSGKPLVLIGGEAPEFAGQGPFGMEIVRACEAFGHPYGGGAIKGWEGVKIYSLAELFDEVTNGKGVKRLGLPDMGTLPHKTYEAILSAVPGVEIVDCGDEMDYIRMRKTDWEIEMVRQAALISEKAFISSLDKINPDMTEYELEGVLAAEIYKAGGEGNSFPIMCYSGYRSRSGIGRSTHNKLGRNTIINIDIGTHFGGYASEYGRPIIFGKMSDETKKEIDFVVDLHDRLVNEWVKPGVCVGDIYEKYYNAFVDNGWGAPPASASHGIGIFEGEAPPFRRGIKTILEPGITAASDHFFRSKEYGFRYSDIFKVTETGTELFTKSYWGYIEL